MVKSKMKTPEEHIKTQLLAMKAYAAENDIQIVCVVQQDPEQPLKGVGCIFGDDPLFAAGVVQLIAKIPEVFEALKALEKAQEENKMPYIIGKDW